MHDAAFPALKGRRVIVTGGARGLGAAFVRSLALSGAQVAFGDVLHDEGNALAAALQSEGHAVHFVPLDLADPVSITRFVDEAVKQLGGLDALINNAAITNSGGKFAGELAVDTWDAVMNVNVRGTWLMSTAALPHLRDSGPRKHREYRIRYGDVGRPEAAGVRGEQRRSDRDDALAGA